MKCRHRRRATCSSSTAGRCRPRPASTARSLSGSVRLSPPSVSGANRPAVTRCIRPPKRLDIAVEGYPAEKQRDAGRGRASSRRSMHGFWSLTMYDEQYLSRRQTSRNWPQTPARAACLLATGDGLVVRPHPERVARRRTRRRTGYRGNRGDFVLMLRNVLAEAEKAAVDHRWQPEGASDNKEVADNIRQRRGPCHRAGGAARAGFNATLNCPVMAQGAGGALLAFPLFALCRRPLHVRASAIHGLLACRVPARQLRAEDRFDGSRQPRNGVDLRLVGKPDDRLARRRLYGGADHIDSRHFPAEASATAARERHRAGCRAAVPSTASSFRTIWNSRYRPSTATGPRPGTTASCWLVATWMDTSAMMAMTLQPTVAYRIK